MSAPPLSKLIRFLLIAAGLIIVFSVVWTFMESSYSNFLTWVAKNNVSQQTLVEQRGGTINFVHVVFSGKAWKPVNDYLESYAIQFGLLLAVALVAATPGIKLWQRFFYSLIAVVITFVLQVLSIIIMAKTYNSLLFVIVSDLVPPILWALFSFRYWFGKPLAAPAMPAELPPSQNKKGRKSA
jgi:hypothetical protein